MDVESAMHFSRIGSGLCCSGYIWFVSNRLGLIVKKELKNVLNSLNEKELSLVSI